MNRYDEGLTGAKEIISWAEEDGKVAMNPTAARRRDGAGVSEQLTLQ